MTYGVMPTREQFDMAFETECPDGYNIRLNRTDSSSVEDFMLGDGCLSANQLWCALSEIVEAYMESTQVASTEDEIRMDLVSSILFTLGFEWI
jgi:hypothetical protein